MAKTTAKRTVKSNVKQSGNKKGLRVKVDDRNEKIGYKIREAQLEKIPYMLVIGKKEQEGNIVAVRSRKDGDIGTMQIEEFENKLLKEIREKE